MTNNQVRKLFINFYHRNYKPNLQEIAKVIGLSYYSFIKWKNHQIEYSQDSLDKITAFLEEQGA